MEDIDVVRAFVHEGIRSGFGPTLHVEGDALLLDGWWPAVYRVGPGAFITRGDESPTVSEAPALARSVLVDAGLTVVGSDLAGITQITYSAQFSLGYVPWDMWAADLEAANAALSVRANEQSHLESGMAQGNGAGDFTTEFGGARRVAGLPPAIIVSVGVDPASIEPLEGLLAECHVIPKKMGEIAPDACGALIPTLMIVDGTTQTGRDFMMELRSVACGRTIPVLAVTDQGIPLGANASIAPSAPPAEWVRPIRDLLP